MKYIILIVVLAILAGGWYIWTNEAEAPLVNETNNADLMDESGINDPDQMDKNETNNIDQVDQNTDQTDENETNNADQVDQMQESDAADTGDTMKESEDTAQQVTEEENDTKVFNVSAKSFEFDVTEMRVQEGDTVTINLSVTEGFHDLVIDEFNVATPQMTSNGQASVTFTADAAGTYEYYCSVGSHRAMGMAGTLIVE